MEKIKHIEDGFSGIKKNENVKTLNLVKQKPKSNIIKKTHIKKSKNKLQEV